jgi:GNAT superfamily N-acetyltransferase
MNNNVNIRIATPKDKENILSVCSKIWKGNDYIFNVIDEWLKNKDSYFFVLEYNGKVTHFERLRIQSGADGWMEGLRGDPDYRGKGLAKKLSQYIIDFSKDKGLKVLRAATYFKNDISIKLTREMGFSVNFDFIFGWKKIEENETESYPKEPIQLIKSDLPKIMNFMNNSDTFKNGYNKFITNGWYYEKHSEKAWSMELEQGKIYTLNPDSLDSLLLLNKSNNDGKRYVITFLEGDDKSRDALLNFAEKKAKDEGVDVGFLSPAKSELSNYSRKNGYNPWEETEANIVIFEKFL